MVSSPQLSAIPLFLFLLCIRAGAAPNFRFSYCPNDTSYAPNTTYQANLSSLFSDLSSNSTAANGFHNSTVGRSPPDVAYGLFLCRGDIDPAGCLDCVTTAISDVPVKCPKSKVTILWYDECMLRFSNQSIFSQVDEKIHGILWNIHNVSDVNQFRSVVLEVMDDLVTRASSSESRKKFATGQGKLPLSVVLGARTLYGLAQCTPDLTEPDCNKCLQESVPNLPFEQQGGRVLFPSCNVRYEVYPFYNVNADGAAPPPPSPALPPSPSPQALSSG